MIDKNFFGSDKASTMSVKKKKINFLRSSEAFGKESFTRALSYPCCYEPWLATIAKLSIVSLAGMKVLIATVLEHTRNMNQSIMHQGSGSNPSTSLKKNTLTPSDQSYSNLLPGDDTRFEIRMGSPEPQSTDNFVSWLFKGVLTDLGLQGIVENAVIPPS